VVRVQSDCLRDRIETTPKSSTYSYLHKGPKYRAIKAYDGSEDKVPCVGFEVLTAVVIKSPVFWDITPCSPFTVNRRLGRTCRKEICLLPV
jgi:hypothetical protein